MTPLTRCLPLLIAYLIISVAYGQSPYKTTYQDIKQFEGTYEYRDGTTLQMAASPKDTLLYAIIGDSKYKLMPSGNNLFLNGGKQEVRFITNERQVTGFTVNDETPDKFYKLITRNVSYSKNMWFARGNGNLNYHWQYHVPQDQKDGLKTGSILDSGLDTALIHAMIDRIISGTYSDVHSILIMKDGKLIVEEYFYQYDANTLHQLRSATKTFTSALVGIAVDKQLIKSKNEKVVSYFTEYAVDPNIKRKGTITIENLLTQQSGLACDDDDSASPGNEVKIYPTGDWVKFVLDLPMIDTPGHEAHYCSGNVFLLNRIIEKVSGKTLHEFAQQNLFDKLGVNNFEWDFVPNQSHQDSFSQLSLRPRDMVKFGLLYLNHGKWNGSQIVSEEWVSQSLANHSVLRGIDYGYLWWCEDLNANNKTYDGMAAKGNGGQRIFIWPSQNMVAVITAGNYNAQSPANKMLIECVLSGLKQ